MNVNGEAMYSAIGSLPPKINGWRGEGGSRFWNFDKEGGHEKIAQKYGG